MTDRLTGVFPVFQTPYHDDETIDAGTLEKEIHWLFDRGADGVVMAMVSEVLRLSTDERNEFASPTGLALSPSGRTVYVANLASDHARSHISAFALDDLLNQ